jgi:hypothetical protein
LLRKSSLAYAQHALNNPKNLEIAPQKKLCEMLWGLLLKVQESFLKIFMFQNFHSGLNKNELLSLCSAF